MIGHLEKFYRKLDLPEIPHGILPSFEEFMTLDGLFITPTKKFRCAPAPKMIHNYVSSFFDYEVEIGVQALVESLEKHSDYGLRGTKIIYNYELGGENVTTQWYDKNNNIIEQVVFKPFTWYELDIDTPHSVSGIVNPRMALQVKGKSSQVSKWEFDPNNKDV